MNAMRPICLRKILLLTLVNLCLGGAPLFAKTWVSDGYRLEFANGLSMVLPQGWIITTRNLDENLGASAPDKKHGMRPVLLLHAQAPDGKYPTSVSVIRDAAISGDDRRELLDAVTSRACEAMEAQGFATGEIDISRSTKSANVMELSATASSGDRYRQFYCVAINRAPESSYRCYWQNESHNPGDEDRYRLWLKQMEFQNQSLLKVLSGEATLPGAEDKPVAKSEASPEKGKEEGELVDTMSEATSLPQNLPPPSAKAADLVAEYSPSLIVVEGKNGMGSGFVCQIGEEKWLLTNIHVLADNPQPQFSRILGEKILPGAGWLAVDHDICKLTVPPETPGLPAMTPGDGELKIGDPIAVLGNAEGAGVVKPLEGRIVGIGPNLIEVDAPFVPGNSGSPIIHVPTGKVIGIATYLITRSVSTSKKGEVKTNVRRFGYRLDSVKRWELVNWVNFYRQSAQLSRIQSAGEDFVRLFDDTHKDVEISPSDYQYPAIRRSLETLQGRFRGSRLSEADRLNAYREFLGNLRLATKNDVATFDTRTAYDFFRRRLEEEKKFREELYGGLTRALESRGR